MADRTARYRFNSKRETVHWGRRRVSRQLLARKRELHYSGIGSFISIGFISVKEKSMSSNGVLINHCGATVVSKEALQSIEAPESTKTWFPVRHQDVLTCVEETLDKSGWRSACKSDPLRRGNRTHLGNDMTTGSCVVLRTTHNPQPTCYSSVPWLPLSRTNFHLPFACFFQMVT